MKSRLLKHSAIWAIALVIFTAVTAQLSVVAAVDNNIDFTFEIRAEMVPNYDKNEQRRSTSDVNNAWKVKLTSSNEPTKAHPDGSAKTATKFYLGINNHSVKKNEVGSIQYNVLEGDEAKYYAAYQKASPADVYLYGRDNNVTNHVYAVSGVWDEETGKKPTN